MKAYIITNLARINFNQTKRLLWYYSSTLKCVTTYNVFTCFHICITSNHYNVYIIARLLIGSKVDIEVCTYIISGHTFKRRTVFNYIFRWLTGMPNNSIISWNNKVTWWVEVYQTEKTLDKNLQNDFTVVCLWCYLLLKLFLQHLV